LSAVLALAATVLVATAQTRAPLPVVGASAPVAGKPGPRLINPVELNENASPPGNLRPESPVTPQIVIPLHKAPVSPSKTEKRALHSTKAAPSGGINDSAARCEAESDEQARAMCRDKIKRENGRR
jgi:hypothetical protein